MERAITAGAAVFTGGLACIAAAGLVVLAFPQLAAYDGDAIGAGEVGETDEDASVGRQVVVPDA